MIKKITLFCFMTIIILLIYLTEGCNVFKAAPTPTPVPTATTRPASTATPEPAKNSDSYLIIPGRGIINLLINKSTLSDVKKLSGDSDCNQIIEEGYIKLIYESQKLTFSFTSSKENTLKSILIENSSYKTAENLGVNSSIIDVRNKYPRGVLDKDKKVYYSDDGTDYHYDAGIITSILLSDRKPVANNITNTTQVTHPAQPTPSNNNSSGNNSLLAGDMQEICGCWTCEKPGGLFLEDITISPNEVSWLIYDKKHWTKRTDKVELVAVGSNWECTKTGGPVHFYRFRILSESSESSDGTKWGPVVHPTEAPGKTMIGVTFDYDTRTKKLSNNLYIRKY